MSLNSGAYNGLESTKNLYEGEPKKFDIENRVKIAPVLP